MKKDTLIQMKNIYAKIVPFWVVKMLPGRTAPAKLRYGFIKDLAKENKIKTFVETGTYLGDTINALIDQFDHIYSFEISTELVDMARNRFKNNSNVEIIHGDSGTHLKSLLERINQKTIFWLDGHYSEGFLYAKKYDLETPIIDEIKTIFESQIKNLDNIILIDDAFEFNGTRGYPTIKELENLINIYTNRYKVEIKYNIIFITPVSKK